jgi:hypothetical protein
MEIKTGMIVKVKKYDRIPGFWNKERMPEYMGKIVTIRCPSKANGYSTTFHIKEDQGKGRTDGWHWRDIDFMKVNTLGD